MNIDLVIRGVVIEVEGTETKTDLMPLQLRDFDVILGMNWLSTHRAQVGYFSKTVTLHGIDGKWVVFRGERNIILSCIISVMTAQKLSRKGCPTYLANVSESKEKKIELKYVPILS